MAVRSKGMVPSTASRVLVKIEDFDLDMMKGVLYSPYLERGWVFNGFLELTGLLDALFDSISFPQAAMDYRSFRLPKKPGQAAEGGRSGPEETDTVLAEDDPKVFIVHVQFRQNADWQGTLCRGGEKEETRFRSTLELVRMMDGMPGDDQKA